MYSRILLIGIAGVLIAGCTGGAKSHPSPRTATAISAGQASELSDGKATFDEYQAAFRRYSACVRKAGYEVTVIGLNYSVYDYRLTEAAAKSPAVSHCYDFEFGQVDDLWQVANENNSATSVHLSECLKALGLQVAPTVREMIKEITAAGVNPATCKP